MPRSLVLMLMPFGCFSVSPLSVGFHSGWVTYSTSGCELCVCVFVFVFVFYVQVKVFSLCNPWWWWWGMSEVTWVSSAAAAKVGAQCLQGSHQGNTACLVPSRIHLSTVKDTQRLPAVLYRDKEEGYIPAFQVALPSLDCVQNRPLCKTKKNHTLHPKVLNST